MANVDLYKWKNNLFKLRARHNLLISSYSSHNTHFKTVTSFAKSDDFKLPVVISGRLVTAGNYYESRYATELVMTPDELKKSLSLWNGIKIYKSHGSWMGAMKGEFIPIDDVIGKIIGVSWNETDKGIDFIAEIDDRDIAYKMARELIDSVSVGFSKDVIWKDKMAYYANIVPHELSCVFNPRDKNAKIKVNKIEY